VGCLVKLEYRLLDEKNDYPVVCFYDTISEHEVMARFACDFFIRGGVIYEKTSCAVEPQAYVIYALESGPANSALVMRNANKGVRLEFRQDEKCQFPGLLMQTYEYDSYIELILHLQSDYCYWQGAEWQKSSAVIDEDRMAYVYYARPNQQEGGA
jgi:hypothetical protein